MPILSVIMSVYNGENYLREAINSILSQTFYDFEFIIIDDASTDNSLRTIEFFALKDKRIKIIKKEINKGIAGFIENLNIGLKNAKGKYIARMDQDDISCTNRFQRQIDFLENNDDIFIVGSDLQIIDEKGKNTSIMSSFYTNKDIQNNMYKNIGMYHPVILFRNNQSVFYRQKMHYCEDYDLYFRLMTENYNFSNLPEKLLKYRILKNSISRKADKIIRWLFVEKARQFYKERERTGRDSYDDFNPDSYLNILDADYKNNPQDLNTAIKTSLKYKSKESLKQIITKSIKQYPNDKKFMFYKSFLKMPQSLYPILSKLIFK